MPKYTSFRHINSANRWSNGKVDNSKQFWFVNYCYQLNTAVQLCGFLVELTSFSWVHMALDLE